MRRALGRLCSLVLMVVVLAVLASPIVQAQLRPEVRDRTIEAAVQIAARVTATDGIDTRVVPVPTGSGTIVSPDGLILTNWHVVDLIEARRQVDDWRDEAAAKEYDIEIDLDEEQWLILVSDGAQAPRQKYSARLVQHNTRLDLAVLQIEGAPESGDLPFVPLGDSDLVMLGDPIDVFGYPAIGGDALTYTTGIVSGFNAETGVSERAWITTDASISGGSSGGTAVDREGRLIGVPTQAPFLDCRPGDSNADGVIDELDVGCVPLGGSIGQLRPVNLARPLLERAGWVEVDSSQTAADLAASQPEPTPTLAPVPTNTPVPTHAPVPTNTPLPPTNTPVPTNTPQPSPSPTPAPATETQRSAPSSGSGDSANVPIERGNAARTGEMPGPAPVGELGTLWEHDVGYGMFSPPVLVDGILYVGSGDLSEENGAVVAVDAATGEELWRRTLGVFYGSPTVSNGRVYIANTWGVLHILDATDGKTIRTIPFNNNEYGCGTGTSPLVIGSQIIASFGCVGPEDTEDQIPWPELTGFLATFDAATGQEQWRFQFAGFSPYFSPAYADGIVLVADSRDAGYGSGAVYAIAADNGMELWRFEANDGFVGSPIVVEGTVYVAGLGGTIFALDVMTGLERWRYSLPTGLGAPPAAADGLVYVGEHMRGVIVIDAATGVRVGDFSGSATFSALTVAEDSIWLGGNCGNVHALNRDTGASRRLTFEKGCSRVTSVVISQGVAYVGTDSGTLAALGDLRTTVEITSGMKVEVAADKVVVRAAPSSGGVERGELNAGTPAVVTGMFEEREGQRWWPIEIDGAIAGWIPESSIIAATVPPTPTPAPRATNTPVPTRTLTPTSTPLPPTSTPLPTATSVSAHTSNQTSTPPPQSAPDREISEENQSLLALLPTQEQVPAGMIIADEAERSKADVVASLGGSDEAAQLLDDWGWSGNAFRDFIVPEGGAPPPGGTTFLNVSVHRFADAESAANALVFHSGQVIFGQGLQEVEPPAIGETARLLMGSPGGVPLAALYAQEGPILYRIGGSTATAESDPSAEVLATAREIIP